MICVLIDLPMLIIADDDHYPTHTPHTYMLVGKGDGGSNALFGLNWKSLTQPAILPLTTDYLPSVSELVTSYDIQTFYAVIVDPRDCAYNSAEALLTVSCLRPPHTYADA